MILNITDLYVKDSMELEFSPAEETVEIVTPDHEEGFGLLIKNTGGSDSTVTVKAGNSIYAMGDLAVSVPGSSEVLVNLKNTGRFKNVHGEKSGKIIVETDGSVEVCAIAL